MPKLVRYDQVKVLHGDTKVLGATAAEWDAAFTGNMGRTLQEVKRLVDSGVRRELTPAASLDVASAVSKRFRQR